MGLSVTWCMSPRPSLTNVQVVSPYLMMIIMMTLLYYYRSLHYVGYEREHYAVEYKVKMLTTLYMRGEGRNLGG